MNDEIKEILSDMLHIICKYGDDFDDLEENEIRYQLPYTKMEKLYDYITNLQQELEEYKDTETYSKRFLYKANKDRLNANLDLVKENERLERENFCLREYLVINKKSIPNDLTKDKDFMEIIDMPTYEDYKSRIEKAVEYLKEHSQMTDLNIYGIENVLSFRGSVDDLLNILNGNILNGKE